MKSTFLFLLIAVSFTGADAQTDIIITSDDNRKSINSITNATDIDGYTYLLSREYPYNPGPGILCRSGRAGDPLFIYKIGRSGGVVWKKHICDEVKITPQITMSDSFLFVPFDVQAFWSRENLEMDRTINCGVFIDRQTGAVTRAVAFHYEQDIDLSKYRFFTDDSDRTSVLLFAAIHKDNCISYLVCADVGTIKIPPNATGTIHDLNVIERDNSLRYKSLGTCKKHLKYVGEKSIVFDKFNDQYVVADSGGLFVYDAELTLKKQIPIPHLDEMKFPIITMDNNRDYYVINYGISRGNVDTFYTAVFRKDGSLVSLKETQHYKEMKISDKNIIYALPFVLLNKFLPDDKVPVALTVIDIRQNILQVKHIGKPFADANSISFTPNNEIIITGTCYTGDLENEMKAPDAIFFHKEKMKRFREQK